MVHCWPSETAAALLSSGYNFLKGSKSVWISSFLQTVGWPFVLFPLIVSYMFRRSKEGATTKLFYVSPRLFLASAVLGVLTGLGWFLFRLWCFSPSCFHFCFYNCHPVSLYCWICFCFGRAKVPIFYHQCNFLVDHYTSSSHKFRSPCSWNQQAVLLGSFHDSWNCSTLWVCATSSWADIQKS